jgi:hypothetical protein
LSRVAYSIKWVPKNYEEWRKFGKNAFQAVAKKWIFEAKITSGTKQGISFRNNKIHAPRTIYTQGVRGSSLLPPTTNITSYYYSGGRLVEMGENSTLHSMVEF